MIECLSLFKAAPVDKNSKTFSMDYINFGVLVEESVISKYSKRKVKEFVMDLVPANSELNKTFHKSWDKVKDSPIGILVAEQILHYMSTYGLAEMGLYNDSTVYIPNEELNLDDDGETTFYVLRGITVDEMLVRTNKILSTGVALNDNDLDSFIKIIKKYKLAIDPSLCRNREMAVRLYSILKITPEDPLEFLRLQVFIATGKSMLIKNKDTIEAISEEVRGNVFKKFEKKYGLTGLASIFYRFKPLFLAFKNHKSASTVNQIRRLAVKHHKPMAEDCIASVTKNLRNGSFNLKKLKSSLSNANIFRKIKLAQALGFYNNKDAEGVVYSIRNGKSFTSVTTPVDTSKAATATLNSIGDSLKHLKGKRVYIDSNLAAPTSGKMFLGDVPFGSSFSTNKSMVVGVCWKNEKTGRAIDLDLSIISLDGKVGWDGSYRDDNFLFSGDITSAPNGATEAFNIQSDAEDGTYLLNLNYYNAHDCDYDSGSDGAAVPFRMFVANHSEFVKNKNSMVSQKRMLFWADSDIDAKCKQKAVGIIKIKDGVKTFYAFESKTGNRMTSSVGEQSRNMIDFYDKYLDSLLSIRSLLELSGAKVISDKNKDFDIDLSLHSLTKDKLINLLVGE